MSSGGEGIKQKIKRTHGHGQQCVDCRGGGEWVEEGIKGVNGNGKNTIKINYKKNKWNNVYKALSIGARKNYALNKEHLGCLFL